MQDTPRFPGFERPESNYFRVPNSFTDVAAAIDNLAELKIVLYVLRHTWGYQEYGITKHITVDEFAHGRKRSDGSRLDEGTGLSDPAVTQGIRRAVEHGYLVMEVDDSDRGRVKRSFRLRMADETTLGPGVKDLYPYPSQLGVKDLYPRPQESLPRSEKETLERQGDLDQNLTSLWSSVLALLQSRMSGANFETWLAGTRILQRRGRRYTVGCPSEYALETIRERLGPVIARALSEVVGAEVTVTFARLRPPKADDDDQQEQRRQHDGAAQNLQIGETGQQSGGQ